MNYMQDSHLSIFYFPVVLVIEGENHKFFNQFTCPFKIFDLCFFLRSLTIHRTARE